MIFDATWVNTNDVYAYHLPHDTENLTRHLNTPYEQTQIVTSTKELFKGTENLDYMFLGDMVFPIDVQKSWGILGHYQGNKRQWNRNLFWVYEEGYYTVAQESNYIAAGPYWRSYSINLVQDVKDSKAVDLFGGETDLRWYYKPIDTLLDINDVAAGVYDEGRENQAWSHIKSGFGLIKDLCIDSVNIAASVGITIYDNVERLTSEDMQASAKEASEQSMIDAFNNVKSINKVAELVNNAVDWRDDSGWNKVMTDGELSLSFPSVDYDINSLEWIRVGKQIFIGYWETHDAKGNAYKPRTIFHARHLIKIEREHAWWDTALLEMGTEKAVEKVCEAAGKLIGVDDIGSIDGMSVSQDFYYMIDSYVMDGLSANGASSKQIAGYKLYDGITFKIKTHVDWDPTKSIATSISGY